MRRDDLRLLLLEAHRLTEADEVLIIGSQSVLGTWNEGELPAAATRSLEADMLVRSRRGVRLTDAQADRVTQFLEHSGMLSEFDTTHGIYIDPISPTTAALPDGWEDRLVRFPVVAEDGAQVVGVCLEPHDACAAKAIANRDHDREFIGAMIRAGLIKPQVLQTRLEMYSGPLPVDHAFTFVQGFLP